MALERELKLSLYGRAPDFGALTELGGYALNALGLEAQVNTYFDTPEFALSRSQSALRIRELDQRSIVTLKGPGIIANGLHIRQELETMIPVGSGLEAVTDPEILSGIARVGLERLKPIVRLETKRHRFALQGVGELTLDRVEVLNNERVVLEFEEIELELEDGVSDGVLENIERAISATAPVRRSKTNKLQRALEAVTHQGQVRADTPWALAASRVIERELERLRAHVPMAISGIDPEGVHGARVSIRRLRAALKVFKSVIPARAVRLNDELRWLGARLGTVRDLDVLLEALPERSRAANLEPDALKPAVRLLERERTKSRTAMIRTLESRRFTRLQERLERLAATALPRVSVRGAGRTPTQLEGTTTIRQVYARLRREARIALVPDAPLEAVHELRKAAKRVRYALEFLEPAIGGTAQDAIAHLKLVQESLGQINDASVTLETLRALAGRVHDARAGFALGVTVGRLEAELTDARREFERTWKKYDPKAEAKTLRNALSKA